MKKLTYSIGLFFLFLSPASAEINCKELKEKIVVHQKKVKLASMLVGLAKDNTSKKAQENHAANLAKTLADNESDYSLFCKD